MIITKSNNIITSKPKTGSIKSTVVNITEINSIDELSDIVLKNPFNASHASGTYEKDWLSQQVFTLDFDSGVSIEEVIIRCRKYSLIPNIIYNTFSDKPELRKFRVMFVLDKAITDKKTAKWVQLGLMQIFKESDRSCSDLCRMYYPGKSIIHKIYELNESDWVIPFLHGQCAANSRFYEKFNYDTNQDNTERPEVIEKYNWDEAISEIKILDLFFNQKYRVSYDILVGLMTNAQYINGGQKKILERMKELNSQGGGTYFPDISRGIELYPRDYFFSLPTIRKYNYMPKSLANFSPFEEDHDFKNLLDIKFKKGKIVRLEQENLISIHDATNLLKSCYQKAKNNIPFKIEYRTDIITGESHPCIIDLDPLFDPLPLDPIYIFKITTGAGKSEAFLNETNALISLPFHSLKDEMSNRMKTFHKITPETPYFSQSIINETISQLRDSGLFTQVSQIIKNIAKGKLKLSGNLINLASEDVYLASLYLDINADCRADNATVLTTHTRAINDLSFKHDFIIFDEDPLSELISIEDISLDFSAFDNTIYSIEVSSIENYLRNIPLNCILPMPRFVMPEGFDKFCASIGKGKLVKLLQSSYLYKSSADVSKTYFCIKKDFPANKKIFIMSATAPVAIYKKIYGNRVIVIDITNIKSIGVVEQYTKRSFSSHGMVTYNTKVYNDLFDNIKNTLVITHMKHSSKFKSHMLLNDGTHHGYYFGNCSGGDKLNGYDVSIIGTPNKPDFVYLFLAEIIGKPNSIDTTLSDQVVEWNDFKFRFFTYSDPDLRDIQLSLIEAELLQAAGRSRFLRNKNTTKIYSSLPLKITTKFC